MKTFKERLCEAMEQNGINAAELSRISGITEGTLSNYKKGYYRATQKNLERLAVALHVSIPWLIGVEETDVQAKLFKSPVASSDNAIFRPVGTVAAGYNEIAFESYSSEIVEVPRTMLYGRPESDYFMLTVKGDSMYPDYKEGDQVLILKQETLNRSGDIGVILYDGDEATLKKVEFAEGEDWVKLIPINPMYPAKVIRGADLENCRVLGIPKRVFREV